MASMLLYQFDGAGFVPDGGVKAENFFSVYTFSGRSPCEEENWGQLDTSGFSSFQYSSNWFILCKKSFWLVDKTGNS